MVCCKKNHTQLTNTVACWQYTRETTNVRTTNRHTNRARATRISKYESRVQNHDEQSTRISRFRRTNHVFDDTNQVMYDTNHSRVHFFLLVFFLAGSSSELLISSTGTSSSSSSCSVDATSVSYLGRSGSFRLGSFLLEAFSPGFTQ